MKMQHAAALALVGWYLMIPSWKSGKFHVGPMSDWDIVESYDSAAECRKELEKSRRELPKYAIFETRERWNNAACISSDDPRLKSN
jgi:hypothetical protein